MTDMDEMHDPTPEFRASLEREMIHAFRRERQFAPPPGALRGGRLRRAIALAVCMVAMLAIGLVWGVGTGFAAAHVQDGSRHAEAFPLAVMRSIPVAKALTALSCNAAGAPATGATAAAPAQQGVPIVDLPPARMKTPGTFGALLGVRQVSNGNVLANDAGRHQLKLLDSTLAVLGVALDSVPGSTNSYGIRPMPLVRYLGDSSLTSDMNAGTLLVLGPGGQVARVMSAPSADLPLAMRIGFSGIDDKGRILFKGRVRNGPPEGGLPGVYNGDSALVLRADLDSRKVDTLGRLKVQASMMMVREKGGPLRFSVEPAPVVDEWAVLADGSIAIVRGHDYHIDWIHADGATHSTTKLPFDWKRLTDNDKQKLIDSARVEHTKTLGTALASRPARGGSPDDAGGTTGGRSGARGEVPPGADAGPPRPVPPMEYLAPALKDVADYYPSIRPGALMPDLDGNLWILPTSSAQSRNGELIYDVVNVQGDFHRVRIPLGRSIAGFGRGGVVYLQSGDKVNGFYLERTKLPGASKPQPH